MYVGLCCWDRFSGMREQFGCYLEGLIELCNIKMCIIVVTVGISILWAFYRKLEKHHCEGCSHPALLCGKDKRHSKVK